MNNAITYYRLQSPYEGDITKNCSLSGLEVDNNFLTLEGRDIKSVAFEDDKIVITLLNGTRLTTEKVTEDCIKDLLVSFDRTTGVLTITQDGVSQEFSGFVTPENIGDLIPEEGGDDVIPIINNAVYVNGSLIGNGLSKKPLGISPVHKTGQYKPVKKIIDTTEGEELPSIPSVFPGDRYLTVENINDYGYLYNYKGLSKIVRKLQDANSPWRVPTKEDWDDMLNAVEPNEEDRNHSNIESNKFLGRFAGKLLKSKDFWKEEEPCPCPDDCVCNNENEECVCGKNITCSPSYCGEYGTCHHRCRHDHRGIDKYGFRALPAGYANEAKDYLYFGERAYFWTATNKELRDAYIKALAYNKSSVLQDIMATDNYMSVRLIKDFDGQNFNEHEDILGGVYSTVLMPSLAHGNAIWTSVNISINDCDCGCKYVLPNGGEGLEYTKRYFINEWNGREWIRKEVLDGESVVVIEADDNPDDELNKDYTEYRVVNQELVDVADLIYNNVIAHITPTIESIEEHITNLEEKVDAEIERSTTKDAELDAKDAELENSINGLSERMTAAEGQIAVNTQDIVEIKERLDHTDADIQALNEKIDAEIERSTAKDAELDEKIDAEIERSTTKDAELDAKDAELDAKIDAEIERSTTKDAELDAETLVNAEFNKDTGVLTLSKKGESVEPISAQFNFNFGTF